MLFVTTTLNTKWGNYSKQLIKKNFPKSEHLIIDGSNNWPLVWFNWINLCSNRNEKWIIHIDEDTFILSKDPIIKWINYLDDNGYGISGTPDGYHPYRGANPICLNTFLMAIKTENLKFFNWDLSKRWSNKYLNNWVYPHKIESNQFNFEKFQEPYYSLFFDLLDNDIKFYYLYPFFNEKYKSTDPKMHINDDILCYHMWYNRIWNSDMDVWGMKNVDRYNLFEKEVLI